MEKVKHVSKKLYEHSFVRYVVIGGTTFTLDIGLLVLFHEVFNLPVIFSATASYWLSIAFNFIANRLWTFGASESSIGRHLTFYLALLGFNYLFTIGFIAAATHMGMHYTIAKVLALACQISWTYIAYKKVIFR